MNLLCNRIILYNRTTSPPVSFVFTCVTFAVFDIMYFCFGLKTLDIGEFLW